jgi:hypothetical protein
MNKEIQKLLGSKKVDEIRKGIDLFESTGTVKELPLLLALLNSKYTEELESRIIGIVSNAKDPNANEPIIEAIYDSKDGGNVRALLQMAWQSSLDFSKHLALFTEVFIVDDYVTALEAFTLIENICQDYNFEGEHKKLLVDKLKEHIGQFDEYKQTLASELIKVIEA